jgi:DNA-binding Lrp family transcriptional regulator
MDITNLQKKILGILSRQGNLSAHQLAKRLRIRPHIVRYQLDKLLEMGTLDRHILINQRALGYQAFNVFFDLPRAREKKAVDFLKGRQEVAWFTRNIGARRYEATIIAKDYSAFSTLLRDLGEEAQTQLRDLIFAVEGEVHHWGLRFLTDGLVGIAGIHFTTPGEVFEIDSVDRKLLEAFQSDVTGTMPAIAKKIGIPNSTFKYRFDRLIASGIISEELYVVRPLSHFVQAQLVVQLKSRSAQAMQNVISTCLQNPNVEVLIHGIGNWDYKICIAAESIQELVHVESGVVQAIGRNLLKHSMYLRNEILSTRSGL